MNEQDRELFERFVEAHEKLASTLHDFMYSDWSVMSGQLFSGIASQIGYIADAIQSHSETKGPTPCSTSA